MARSTWECPFVPGAGKIPGVWAGRNLELADAEASGARRLSGVYDRGRAVLGEFGIGKSVLLNRIGQDLELAGHWVAGTLRVTHGDDPLPRLAGLLRDLVDAHSLAGVLGRRAGGLLDRIDAITLPVIGGGLELAGRPADPLEEVTDLLRHLGRLAREEGRLVLVRIDEIQNADPAALSRLLTVLADALDATMLERDSAGTERERALPLLVYVCGLPDFRRLVADAGARFARRLRTFDLDYLDVHELRAALHPFTDQGWPVLGDDGPAAVHMAPEAVDLIVDRCLGDPFLFQLAGEAAWRAGDGLQITGEEARRGWGLVRRETLRYVEGRMGDLSDLQLSVLRAAASLPESGRTGEGVARVLGRGSSSELASTLQSLDRVHRLVRREAGRLTFRSEAVRRHLVGDWP